MHESGWPDTKAILVSDTTPPTKPLTIDGLVHEHTDFIWRLLRRLGLSATDADDATQQVFMVAAKNLTRMAPANARSFLYGTAVRVANNTRRGIRRQKAIQLAHSFEESPSHPGPDNVLQLRQACAYLDEILSHLPEEQRRVLVLVEIEQLELSRVAELEGIPTGTATSRLRLARARFAALLEQTLDRNPLAREND